MEKSALVAGHKQKANRWLAASLLLLVLAGVAILLLWLHGPLAPRFSTPEELARHWRLPEWLWLTSLATLVLTTPAALICAAIGAAKMERGPGRLVTIVGLLLVLLLVALFWS